MSITINEFLKNYGTQINSNVEEFCFKPLYDKKNEDIVDYKNRVDLKQLLRQPKEGQYLPILAGQKALQNDNLLLIGEMGFGKTMTALSISKILQKPKSRVLVMCPGHLVQKWIREIKITIPHAIIINMNNPGLSEIDKLKEKPKGREFWIIGKERAKNHFFKKDGYLVRNNKLYCPKCGNEIIVLKKKKMSKCTKCHEVLWQADNRRTKRYAKSEYIKRKFQKPFDLFIADEFHLYKAGDSAQGTAFSNFVISSKRTIGLSGTLMGGYSSNLFYLLYRMFPNLMSKTYQYNDITKFVKKYGVLEVIEKEPNSGDGKASIQKRVTKRTVERAGISPLIFSELLLEKCIFIRLSDNGGALPKYNEHIISVEMEDEQKEQYIKLELELRTACQKALQSGSKKYLGALVQSLLAYPDGARRGEYIYDPSTDEDDENAIVASAEPVEIDLLPKEKELINIIERSKQAGNKTLVLLEHTGKRNMIPDLQERIERNGIKTVALYSDTCPASKRESWIKKNAKDNDVLICNPRLVETGLDLLEYTDIVFFQTGYNPFTVRQASRRSYRINQTKDINVYFLAYKETMQMNALTLISEKTQVSLACEGELSNIGLTELAKNNTSMLIELAKSLINQTNHDKDVKIISQVENDQVNDQVENDQVNEIDQDQVENDVNDTHDFKKVQKYERINRGIIRMQDNYGVFILDNGERLKFSKGEIFYNGNKCGYYDKQGKGKISKKDIEIYSSDNNTFELIEIKAI